MCVKCISNGSNMNIFCIQTFTVLILCSTVSSNALIDTTTKTFFSITDTIGDFAEIIKLKVASIFTDIECGERWHKPNMTDLRYQLLTRLHGQHVVVDAVVRSISGHLRFPEPEKALVLSFHGTTGSGKNYVSRIVAEILYKSGMKSAHVHLIHAPSVFPHEAMLPIYQDQLRSWIRGNVSACERNLFIFDEMDKMPSGLINTIKPFLDHYPQIEGIDYRKNIFILLSNTGGREIADYTLTQWKTGSPRQDIKYNELEQILTRTAFNEKGGLWHSTLIDHNLISAFIPFLPMERQHIVKCIEDDLRQKNLFINRDLVAKVADEMHYTPQDIKLFSTTGCKRVSEKVNFHIELHDEL